MRSMLLTTFLLTIVVLAFVPVKPTLAFDSFPHIPVLGIIQPHDRITNEALAGFGFSTQALDRVKSAARNQDWSENGHIPLSPGYKKPNENYHAEHHFDSNTEAHSLAELQSRSQTAFINGALYVKQQRDLFLGYVTVCTTPALELGLDALGRALHALEDLYAHSNFVDLDADDQTAVLNAFNDPGPPPKPQPPTTLEITYCPAYNQPDTSASDLYPHGGAWKYNKDNSGSSSEAGFPVRADSKYAGNTKFQAAYKFAVDHKKAFMTSCKQQLNNDTLWVKKFGEYTGQVPSEIPPHYWPLYPRIQNKFHVVGIPAATVDIFFANHTLVASFSTDYDGSTGWYFPEETYYCQVSATGYQPYTSNDFVLNTDMVYLVISLTPESVGGIVVPVDKFGLLAPYVGLASATMIGAVATVIYVKRVKRRKEKQ